MFILINSSFDSEWFFWYVEKNIGGYLGKRWFVITCLYHFMKLKFSLWVFFIFNQPTFSLLNQFNPNTSQLSKKGYITSKLK